MKIETAAAVRFPPEIAQWITGDVYTQNGMNAETFFSGDVFVKTSAPGTLATEAQMTRWFHDLGLGAEVLDYVTADRDYLVTRRIPGEDGTTAHILAHPEKLAREHGRFLRRLHDAEFPEPPRCGITAEYVAQARQKLQEAPPSDEVVRVYGGCLGLTTVKEAGEILEKYAALLCEDVVIHGDFCLPNVLYDEKIFPTGFIDLGSAGRGDRHFDLFWGIWSLRFNLHTDAYADVFLDAYGRDRVSRERLLLMAAVNALLGD